MNTGVLCIRLGITVFLSLYATRVVLQALGTDDFGIFSLVGGTIAMLSFLNGSMTAATQRFMSYAVGQGDEQRLHQVFNVSLVLHAGIALLSVLVLEVVGFVLFDRVLSIKPDRVEAAWLVYQFAAISMFFTILAVPYDAVINAREHMVLFAVLGVVESVLRLAAALVIAMASTDRLELYGLLMAVLSIFLLMVRVGYCRRKYQECEISPRRHFDLPLFKEMGGFASWSLLGISTGMLSNYGQAPLLNMFFGTMVNAAQGIVAQVSGQLGAFANVMLRAINPLIAKSEGAGDRELMLKASMFGSKVGFFLLTIIYVPVLVELPYLFELWLGQVPEYAVVFCYLLLVRNLIEQLYITLAASISAVGRIRRFQAVSSLLALAPLPIAYAFFEAGFGPYILYMVFITYSLSAFGTVLHFSRSVSRVPVGDYLKNVVTRCVGVLGVSLVVGSTPVFFVEQGLPRLLAVCSVSVAATTLAIWFVGLSGSERDAVKKHAITTLPKWAVT